MQSWDKMSLPAAECLIRLQYLLPWVESKHPYLLPSDGTVNVQRFSRSVDNFVMFA